MAAVEKPRGIKAKAFLDDVFERIAGRRLFTSIVTDSAIDFAIKRAKTSRGGSLTPSPALLARAGKSFKNVERR